MPGRGKSPERLLTTVLMTDIVGSTERAAELGDAALAPATDTAAAAASWAEVDRMATDLAFFAPLFNEGTDLLASRVGNYQFHPGLSLLVDQLWVQ